MIATQSLENDESRRNTKQRQHDTWDKSLCRGGKDGVRIGKFNFWEITCRYGGQFCEKNVRVRCVWLRCNP